ncbi:hypothetical protein DHEL01_v202435 [Diaporthe helianthi]|uniref:Glycine zipper 2TM domain-containing protein n=1 Tax=Diaporthe helianthi TaxID=158607 RepID=A0A2P5I9I3_DIAHE|nr:hypothetical protein DHEL01_v202435 [Diaporthe helianthi]
MSAADYYGGHPSQYQQHSQYAAPQQQQYAPGPASSYDNRQTGQPQDGEKGLMATVIGGGAGGAIGHKMSHGSKFKTLLGGAAGAAVANAIEHKIKGKKQPSHGHGHGHGHGHHPPPPPHHAQHHAHHGQGGSFGGLLPAPGSQHGGSMSSLGSLFGGKQHHGPPSHHSSHHGHHGHHKW